MTQVAVCAFDVHFAPSLSTGKERDTESGNDYFGARYYASSMGRFLSPDWSAKQEPVPYAKLDDPQSLNLYSYVRNNPLTRVDLDGHSGCKGSAAAICKAIMDAISDGVEAGAAMMGQKLKQLPASNLKPPGLPSGVVHLTYWSNAPRLSAKVERKLQKEIGAPGVLDATIGFTTNGKHDPKSNHYLGLAADIESINGTPMTNAARDGSAAAKSLIDGEVEYANAHGAHEVYAPGAQLFKDGVERTASTPKEQKKLDDLADLHATHLHVTVGRGDE